MKSGFCDKGIEIIHIEHLSACQSADDERNSLELRMRLRNVVFVHTECLHVQVVCMVFETTFIRDLERAILGASTEVARIEVSCLTNLRMVDTLVCHSLFYNLGLNECNVEK